MHADLVFHVAVETEQSKKFHFVEIKNGLSLSQIVAFSSGSIGYLCS